MKATMLGAIGPSTPVRIGKFYCSAECGHGCTHYEYLSACLQAEALANRMGVNWKPEVWENLGWRAQVVCEGATVQILKNDYGIELDIAGVCQVFEDTMHPIQALKKLVQEKRVILTEALKSLDGMCLEAEDIKPTSHE